MKNSTKIILVLVIVVHFMVQLTHEFSLRPKYFKVERAASCKPASNHLGKLERFDLTQPTKNLFHLDADLRILKDITESIKCHMRYEKCTLVNEGYDCDDHETTQFDNICDRLLDKNAMWTPLIKSIKPKLMCPIKQGLYTVRNGTFDLSMFSVLPLDGYRYVTTISLNEHFKNDTPPLQMLCLDSDVIISLQSNSRTRTRNRG